MRSVACRGLDKPWSVITFGCWQIAPSGGWGDYCSSEDADASVKAALEGGITAGSVDGVCSVGSATVER